MSAPIFIADGGALEAYLEKFAKRMAEVTREATLTACQGHKDPDDLLSPTQVEAEIDISRDAVYQAIRRGRLVNQARPREGAQRQRNGRSSKQRVLVRRADAFSLWPNKVR